MFAQELLDCQTNIAICEFHMLIFVGTCPYFTGTFIPSHLGKKNNPLEPTYNLVYMSTCVTVTDYIS